MERCGWVKPDNVLYVNYHDHEWGVPVHEDRHLFEMLILEGAQAGLSWETILKKRESYRLAFDNFEPKIVAKYDDDKIEQLMQNPGIVRNRLKIKATIKNAKVFMAIQEEFGSFDKYLWGYVDGKPLVNTFLSLSELPAKTELSDRISKDLKKRGMSFIGSTILYAYMQAVGLVNDHTMNCFRYREVML